MADDIYQTIWNNTGSHISVSRRGANGDWENPEADVLLDEQGRWQEGECTSEFARRPLFAHVNENIFSQPSFQAFITLLDNFTAEEGAPEAGLNDPDYAAEVDAFLDAIQDTEPMRLAREYVQTEVRPGMTDGEFRDQVRLIWFETFENNFSSREPFCVGFEHVFVGETERPGRCKDAVGGYHSWIKYYLDQKGGKATYLGNDYRGNLEEAGLADPNVATVIMTWTPSEEEGASGEEHLKRPGGFFVGTRPECDIALGTVGLFEVLADRFQNETGNRDERRVRLGQSIFDLVLHPQTIRRSTGELGPHLRTFYPKLKGGDGVVSGGEPQGGGTTGTGPGVVTLPTQPHNNGAIRIFRALPNPPGSSDRGEWVEIVNVNVEDMDLTGWRLADQENRSLPLSGILASGETRRIELDRDRPDSVQLSNSGGWILLFEGQERRAAVRYGRASQGKIFKFF